MRVDILTPARLCDYGLIHAQVFNSPKYSATQKERAFKKHYGAPPLALAAMWFDLQTTTIPEAALSESENSIKGLNFFLIAHSWIWTYQRNAKQLADKFSICEDYAKGKKLWGWIGKLAALKAKKIVWDPAKMDDPNGPTFICSLDGTDFKVWEPKHPTLPQDRRQMSFKMKHAALKYEIAVCNFESQICWVSGPYRGAKHDISVFRDGGLKEKVQIGKLLNVDRGYQSSRPDERCLSCPNPLDSNVLYNYKSRSRLCGETFNGRLKQYSILENTF
jgi:hypothetical protein